MATTVTLPWKCFATAARLRLAESQASFGHSTKSTGLAGAAVMLPWKSCVMLSVLSTLLLVSQITLPEGELVPVDSIALSTAYAAAPPQMAAEMATQMATRRTRPWPKSPSRGRLRLTLGEPSGTVSLSCVTGEAKTGCGLAELAA